MKRFLLFLALLFPLLLSAQTILRNSLTTNNLDTNFVWFPSAMTLRMSGASPRFSLWNTSGGADLKRFDLVDGQGQLRFEWTADNGGSSLLLGTFSSDGNFAPVSLSLSGRTNRLTISSTNTLLLDGVPIVTGSTTTTNTVANYITVNSITNIFNTSKGGHLVVSNSLTIITNGVLSLQNLPWPSVLLVGADGNVTNATLSGLTLSATTLTAGFGNIYRDQSIEAGAMFAGPTAATAGTYTNLVNDTLSDSWTFADAATQSARFSLTLPDAWNIGTIKLKLYVTCDNTNTATTTNLVWGVKAGSMAPGEALTNAIFGTQVFVTNGLNTAGNVMQVFTTPAITIGGSPALGDSLWFDVSRQGSNSSDDWTNTPVRLLKARVQWLEGTTAPSVW
jgi:hypothetical protein